MKHTLYRHYLPISLRPCLWSICASFLLTPPLAAPAQAQALETIHIEAEAGELTGAMTIGEDPQASGGQFVYSTSSEQGTASYSFTVPAGNYVV